MTVGLGVEGGRLAVLWMLGAFVIVFLATRVVVRLIRAGRGPFRDTSVGGVHVHHAVYGIFAMLVAGIGEFTYRPDAPVVYVLAAVFGAGAALTLDEFALWLRLEDVYWSAEGRVSVDAVVLAAAVMALLVLGANPFDPEAGGGAVAVAGGAVATGAVAVVALLKGRLVLGLLGLLVPLLAVVGALRLARPSSPWARRRYASGSAKAVRSRERFPEGRRTRWDAIVEAVAGAPNTPSTDRTAEDGATREG